LKPDYNSAVFLDTIFLLLFFQIDINVKAFSLERYSQFLTKISEAHLSELSIFEAKAKLFRLSRIDETRRRKLQSNLSQKPRTRQLRHHNSSSSIKCRNANHRRQRDHQHKKTRTIPKGSTTGKNDNQKMERAKILSKNRTYYNYEVL